MKYRAIIHEAWMLTQDNKKLIWWFAFVPALLSLIVGMVYLVYQAIAFWSSPYISGGENRHVLSELAGKAFELLNSQPGLVVLGIVLVAVVGLAYLILPVFTQGALIRLVAHMRAGESPSVAKGISYGFSRFLQLFEYHLFIKTFSFVGILTEAAVAFRVFGPESFELFGWIFLLLLFVGLLLTLLFTYSEYYIVIDKEGVFKSILKSSGLVIRQWHHTLFMVLLMAIIIVRVGFNVLVALLVPALVLGPIFFFTTTALAQIGALIGAVVGLIVLHFSSYFLGVFHMFATTVWTFTFLELTKEDAQELNLHQAAVQYKKEEVEEAKEQ